MTASEAADSASGGADGAAEDRAVIECRIAEAGAAFERGWALLPIKGKKPFKKEWQSAPRPSKQDVEQWAALGNVGLRTGAISGVVVIDDDTLDGSGTAELSLPVTPTVLTGSGKRHFYFKAPAQHLGNATGQLPKKVDLRADGGQVVFVGSVHPDTGRPYTWAPGRSPEECALAELPQNVLDLILAPKPDKRSDRSRKPRTRRSVSIDQSARAALVEATDRVERCQEGQRNQTLYAESLSVGRWVAAGKLPRAEVEASMCAAARQAGLPDGEAARTIASGLDAAQAGAAGRARPTITLEGGKLPNLVDKAEAALLGSGAHLYQRGHQVVRVVRAAASTMQEVIRRAEGVLMLAAVEVPYLVELLTKSARWFRLSRDELVEVDCPERVAKTYLARAGHWRLPTLLGLIEAPTLRPDGSILQDPGYDSATGLYFDPGGAEFPSVPESPTREDAGRALNVILDLLKDFPWLQESDRSAAVAAILTALVRPSLRTAPLFAFRAPIMGSGKSLLADVVAMIATGRVASMMSQGKDEDEDKKRLLSILMEGIAVACIDNVEYEFGGAAMCSVLTQESWRDRILGKSGTATVPTATTWLVTGNNVVFKGDIVTRVVVCDLDPGVERPEERRFDVDLHGYIPRHRGELVVAGLTILRAFWVAGRPDQGLPTFGRFETWSDWVRSALVWLGQADPCAGRERLSRIDPVATALGELLAAWYAAYGAGGQTATAVAESIMPNSEASGTALAAAVMAVAQGRLGRPDARHLGAYLAKHERRIVGGLRIERVGDRQGRVVWRVMPVSGVQATASGDADVEGLVTSVSHFPATSRANSSAAPAEAPGAGEAEGTCSNDTRNGETSGTDSQKSQDPLRLEAAGRSDPSEGVALRQGELAEIGRQAGVEVDPDLASTADPVVLRRAGVGDLFVTTEGVLVRFTKLTLLGNDRYLTPGGREVRILNLVGGAS